MICAALRTVLRAYFFCCSVRRIREESACLRLKKRLISRRPGTVKTICLIDMVLDAGAAELDRRSV